MKLQLTSFAEFLSFSCLVFNVSSSTWMPSLFRQSAVVQQNIVTLVSNHTEVVLITRNVILLRFGFFCSADLFPCVFILFSYHSLAGECKTSYTGLQACCASIFLSPFCYSWLFTKDLVFYSFSWNSVVLQGITKNVFLCSSFLLKLFLHQNWWWTLQFFYLPTSNPCCS